MEIHVNGTTRKITYAEDTPLLWVLRDDLKLKGTKFGCGKGLCGACTVHLNGQPIRSCITPVGAIAGQNITTIEGLGSAEAPHVLQEMWIKHNVPQCGYCQSGQLMSAAALLATNAMPSPDEVDQAMSGNICRCGTYPRIKSAIQDAANSTQA